MNVSEAVARRMSTRAYTQEPVSQALVAEILNAARQTPSGGNLQPWRVYVLTGAPLADFKARVAAKMAAGVMNDPNEYDIYPADLWEPFAARRRHTGMLRYGAIGIEAKDPDGAKKVLAQNYSFFGAPVGLFFCLDRRLGPPQWSDLGMFMQTVMLLAVERGVDTCPQEAWSNWSKTVAAFLNMPPELLLFSGMAMGYGDMGHKLNGYRTPREPLASFTEFRGF